MTELAMTQPQRDYIESLAKKFSLPMRMLDEHTVQRFGAKFDELTMRQASLLLDEMIAWKALPADLMRAKGQMDLFR
jgi:hypothetical protein